MIIATKNEGKAKEFENMFKSYGYEVKTLLDYPDIPEIPETGSSFKENALQKATAISERLDTIVLADDSGLEVDALNGQPGIYSARYAGEHGNDEKNNEKLLNALVHTPKNERGANFHCSLVLVGPNKDALHVTGKVNGHILKEPHGSNGFGYDPIFYLPEKDKTMAELEEQEKNQLSHRAKAINQLKEHLNDWL